LIFPGHEVILFKENSLKNILWNYKAAYCYYWLCLCSSHGPYAYFMWQDDWNLADHWEHMEWSGMQRTM